MSLDLVRTTAADAAPAAHHLSAPTPTSSSTGTGHVLVLQDVTVRHPDGLGPDGRPREVTALDQVCLAAAPGTVTAVLGPSGSGKSTVLSVVAGLVVPSSGTVEVGGERLDRLGEDARTRLRRERVGLVFQQPNLLPSLTVVEQLVVTAHLAGASRGELRAARARALELLERVGLADQVGRRPHQLSGGQRQRVNIARALMARPTVLLADEPTSALDHERAQGVVHLLAAVTRELGVATLLVTHDVELTDVADRIVTLRDGRVVPPVNPL